MSVQPASRTPEGAPNHCPLCGSIVRIEPSQPSGDATCPICGHLLWFVASADVVRFWDRADYPERLRRWIEMLYQTEEGPDSLDLFELAMETEEEFDICLPSSVSLTIRTPADLAAYLLTSPPDTE